MDDLGGGQGDMMGNQVDGVIWKTKWGHTQMVVILRVQINDSLGLSFYVSVFLADFINFGTVRDLLQQRRCKHVEM